MAYRIGIRMGNVNVMKTTHRLFFHPGKKERRKKRSRFHEWHKKVLNTAGQHHQRCTVNWHYVVKLAVTYIFLKKAEKTFFLPEKVATVYLARYKSVGVCFFLSPLGALKGVKRRRCWIVGEPNFTALEKQTKTSNPNGGGGRPLSASCGFIPFITAVMFARRNLNIVSLQLQQQQQLRRRQRTFCIPYMWFAMRHWSYTRSCPLNEILSGHLRR